MICKSYWINIFCNHSFIKNSISTNFTNIIIFGIIILTLVEWVFPCYIESFGSIDSSANTEKIYPSKEIFLTGIATDSNGTLYIADTFNDRIQKINPDGNITIIGKEGSKSGEFKFPSGIATDSNGTLYIADTNRIQKINPDGNITITGKEGPLANISSFYHKLP